MEGAFEAMWTGEVDFNWAKEHHNLWLEEELAKVGFFGIGADYYPIPWSMLRYTEKLGGYQVNITEAQLKNAPKFGANENWDWSNRQSVQNYWDISYPWPPD
jgi:hypothetical protein